MAIPTLVVGLGGTGVLTLRALKKLYEELPDKERVPASFLAYDFDRLALETRLRDDRFAKLAEGEFYYLDPQPIHDVLRNLDRQQDGKSAWENILCWFPDVSRLRVPDSEAAGVGTRRLRCLGRLGFFLNDELIEGSLRRALFDIVQKPNPARLADERRVILVSSIAGGTGAGMLIDMAYLARRQQHRPRVFGYLLLPDVFTSVAGGDLIYQNAYACLKELDHLKQQSIPFDAQYLRIPPTMVPVAGEELMARIFLANGTTAPGKDAIGAAAAQLAETILPQLQVTIQEKILAIVSNTISASAGDWPARSFTFSTARSASIQPKPVTTPKNIFSKLLQNLLKPYSSGRRPTQQQLAQILLQHYQKIFERRVPKQQRRSFTLVMLPSELPPEQLKEASVEAELSSILESRFMVEAYNGERVWAYFEDLFNPVGNIKDIDIYFVAYSSHEQKELFHIDRRMLANPLFVDFNEPYPVRCSNPDCVGNIADLPRTELICPNCDCLIGSRCGNPSCTADDLDRQEKGAAKSCPSCGGFNHAAWWVCRKHGKIAIDIPLAQERCPRCLEEHEKDPIAWPTGRISLRPDLLDRILCPRCADLAENDPAYTPFRVSRDLVPFYRNGVNGHDEPLFATLASRHHLPEGCRCPACRTLLIPVHHEGSFYGDEEFRMPLRGTQDWGQSPPENSPFSAQSHRAILLFRRPGSHVFLTASDPESRYEVLCGHCDFPLATDDDQCPRCQRFLEYCSACITVTHRKSLHAVPDPGTGGKRCSVCGVLRIPFGRAELSAVKGAFCANLYGCPAGGLLLRTGEFAVLPQDASLCPICRDAAFKPLDLRVFLHLMSRCLFCNNCLGSLLLEERVWSDREAGLLAVGRLQMPESLNAQPCPLCARDDRPGEGETLAVIHVPEDGAGGGRVEVSASQYRRVVQLGRALIFAKEKGDAFGLTFATWFRLEVSRVAEDPITVGRVGELLLRGTLRPEVHRALRGQLESLLTIWEQKLPSGVSYNVGGISSELDPIQGHGDKHDVPRSPENAPPPSRPEDYSPQENLPPHASPSRRSRRLRAGVDIGILTIVSEEMKAVCDALKHHGTCERKRGRKSAHIFYYGLIPSANGTHRVIATQALAQGNRSIIPAYNALRDEGAPLLIVLLGIGGGIHSSLTLGDVAIADRILYYDERKETQTGVSHRLSPDKPPAWIIPEINDFFVRYGNPAILRSRDGSREFKAQLGPIGTGDAVIGYREAPTRQYLLKVNDKTLCVETEAGGVARAFYEEQLEFGTRTKGYLSLEAFLTTQTRRRMIDFVAWPLKTRQ